MAIITRPCQTVLALKLRCEDCCVAEGREWYARLIKRLNARTSLPLATNNFFSASRERHGPRLGVLPRAGLSQAARPLFGYCKEFPDCWFRGILG
jgi:hypothetical protein